MFAWAQMACALTMTMVGSTWAEPADYPTQRVAAEQRLVLPAPTMRSTFTVSYPKTTDGPTLRKRKEGSMRWDGIQEEMKGRKRDGMSCPAEYNLCPKSLNGGCCPSDRICGATSCLPTTAASAFACGRAGYIACGISEGGGCCPGTYQCATNGCIPIAGIIETVRTCSANSFLCPAFFNYGCCQSGQGCALNSCYATSISIFTYTDTLTSTDAELNAHTLTSTITASTILGAPNPTETVGPDLILGKLLPSATAIAKTPSTSTPDSGLSKPQIGGIIGGACTILLVLILAAILILRRLHHAIQASEHSSTHTATIYRRAMQGGSHMSVDPLLMSPSEASSGTQRPSHIRNASSSENGAAFEVEANSPPTYSPRSPPSAHYYQKGYNPVSSSESLVLGNHGHRGSGSLYSALSAGFAPQGGYFDVPLQAGQQRRESEQVSPPIGRPSHGRHWSDASEVSQSSDGGLAELDVGDGERGRWGGKIMLGLGLKRLLSKRKSEPLMAERGMGEGLVGQGERRREDMASLRQKLWGISEAGESRLQVGGMSNAQFREVSLLDR